MDDYTKIKQALNEVYASHDEANKLRFENITARLDKIDNHLEKLNGKVAKHEQQLNIICSDNKLHYQSDKQYRETRPLTCPQAQRIQQLENDRTIKLGVKQVVVGFITMLSVMIGIAFTSIKISEHYNTRDNIEQTKEIIKEVMYEMREEYN